MPNVVGTETRPVPAGSGPAPTSGQSALEAILGAAESAVGTQYRWGGNSLATGVDCSGLVQQAFRAAGINLPRVSADQARVGQQVAVKDMKPGDLVWYDNSGRNQGADHIAIYMGNGLMAEAPHAGAPVRIVAVRPPTGVTRVLGAVEPTGGVPVPTLGSNQDRAYTRAAIGAGPAPTPTAVPNAGEQMGGGLGDDLPPDATPQQVEAYIRKHYTDVAPFLANDEIKKLAYDAAVNDLSPDEVTHRFEQTTYYKTHGPTSRQLDELLGRDRAAADELIGRASNIVGDLFSQNGMPLDDAKAGAVAKQAIRNGWISTQGAVVNAGALQDFLAFSLGKEGKPLGGAAGASADTLGATARDYGITLSKSALDDWVLRIIDGRETEDSFKGYVTDLARGLWPNSPDVLKAIDSGRTLNQFFDPHRQIVADALQLAPDQVDLFSDPRWQQITHFYDPTLDGGKGGTRTMTLGEVTKFARSQPEYENNPVYKDTKAQAVNQLLAWTGKVA